MRLTVSPSSLPYSLSYIIGWNKVIRPKSCASVWQSCASPRWSDRETGRQTDYNFQNDHQIRGVHLPVPSTTWIKKKDALLNVWLRHWKSKKLIKILDHFEALEKLFHLAPTWYLYLFFFRNCISLSKNIAKFVFAVPLKKMQFSKMVSHFKEL